MLLHNARSVAATRDRAPAPPRSPARSSASGTIERGTIVSSLDRLGSIGDRADDPPTERLRHRFLVYMGVLMSVGALVWGGLCLAFGLLLPSIIPFGYLVVTAVNLGWFAATKGFA